MYFLNEDEVVFSKDEIMLMFGSLNIVHSLLGIHKQKVNEYNYLYDQLSQLMVDNGWFGDGG